MARTELSGLSREAWGAAGMTSQTGEGLLRGLSIAMGQGLRDGMERLARQLEQLRRAGEAQVEAIGENTQALRVAAAQGSGGGWATAGEVARGALRLVGGGWSLSPLLSGLFSLFGRKKSEQPPPVVTYERPPALHFEGTAPRVAGGAFWPIDYGAGGLPRAILVQRQSAPAQVTVNVNAMDSRSFLERSDEIARAVREAMLNAHALNDVVNEL